MLSTSSRRSQTPTEGKKRHTSATAERTRMHAKQNLKQGCAKNNVQSFGARVHSKSRRVHCFRIFSKRLWFGVFSFIQSFWVNHFTTITNIKFESLGVPWHTYCVLDGYVQTNQQLNQYHSFTEPTKLNISFGAPRHKRWPRPRVMSARIRSPQEILMAFPSHAVAGDLL